MVRKHLLKSPAREPKNIASLLFRQRPRLVQQRDHSLFCLVLIQPNLVRKIDGYLHCFAAFSEKDIQSGMRSASSAVLEN